MFTLRRAEGDRTMKRIIFALAAVGVLTGSHRLEAQEFQVVVHAGAGLTEISRDDLSRIFQKKSGRLPSGENANPVDRGDDAAVREAFSQAVHGRSAQQIAAYWQQQVFSGKDFPPQQKDSDQEVLAYVASTTGAIGYVAAGASVGAGVKVVRVSG